MSEPVLTFPRTAGGRVDQHSVMKQLKAWEHPKMRAVNAKHGAGTNQFGVNLGKLRSLATQIKRDHTLALELWKSGNIDAMNLATLIMDPKQLTQPHVEKLAKDLSYYTTTDWFVKNVIKALPFKGELCKKWAASSIAVDYPQLRKRAIAIGNTLEVLKDYPVPKGCTSPFAPIWIAYILEHRR